MDIHEAKELVSNETGWHCFDAFSTGDVVYVIASPVKDDPFARAFYPVENGSVGEPLSVGDLLYLATSNAALAEWILSRGALAIEELTVI